MFCTTNSIVSHPMRSQLIKCYCFRNLIVWYSIKGGPKALPCMCVLRYTLVVDALVTVVLIKGGPKALPCMCVRHYTLVVDALVTVVLAPCV